MPSAPDPLRLRLTIVAYSWGLWWFFASVPFACWALLSGDVEPWVGAVLFAGCGVAAIRERVVVQPSLAAQRTERLASISVEAVDLARRAWPNTHPTLPQQELAQRLIDVTTADRAADLAAIADEQDRIAHLERRRADRTVDPASGDLLRRHAARRSHAARALRDLVAAEPGFVARSQSDRSSTSITTTERTDR